MIRAYLPLTSHALAAQWPCLEAATVLAPGPAQRRSGGEELELWEYRAMAAAAASVAEAALEAHCPRAIVACDIDDSLGAHGAQVIDGIVAIPAVTVAESRVASVHIDDPEGFRALPEDREAALEALADSDLLWFDSAEVGDLVELFGQLPADDGLQG